MHCFANGIEVIILMFEYIEFYLLFRIIMYDSFLLMSPTVIMTLHDLLSMRGQLGKHLLVLFLRFSQLGILTDNLLPHIILISGGKYKYESRMIEIYA